MLGPGSDELKRLTDILRKADPADAAQYMTEIRQHLVFEQKGDTRKAAEIEKAKNRTEKAHDKIIVQRYICHELDYQKRKFDLRKYMTSSLLCVPVSSVSLTSLIHDPTNNTQACTFSWQALTPWLFFTTMAFYASLRTTTMRGNSSRPEST
jgi:hypothetical protein